MTPSVVLVTGVSRFLGARLATALVGEPGVARVIGVDVDPPLTDFGAAAGPVEFVRADIRNPRVAGMVAEAGVDTVVHAGVGADGASTREADVTGTLQLLAACQRSTHLRRLVVRSTTAVYGSTARDPAVFVEEDFGGTRHTAAGHAGDGRDVRESTASPDIGDVGADPPARVGYARNAAEVESSVHAFGRRRPDVSVTVLRLANLVGPRAPTPLTHYFGMPVIPTVWGHDPRLQFVHEQDAVEVFRLAVRGGGPPGGGPLPGRVPGRSDTRPWTVNVAGSGVLTLSQAIRRAGRMAVPVPGVAGAVLTELARRAGLPDRRADLHPDRTGLLVLDGIVDTTRLRREFGYQPRFTSAQAFDEFVRCQLSPGGLPADG